MDKVSEPTKIQKIGKRVKEDHKKKENQVKNNGDEEFDFGNQ